MKRAEQDLRRKIIATCREMNALGINQGTSGNVSAREGSRMLISPSAIPYDRLEPEMVAAVELDDPDGAWEGPFRPSVEWRIHQKLLRRAGDADAVIHAHPPYCTALAMARRGIPSCHYMVAAFGGNDVRCADYATFGSERLAELTVEAIQDRTACLMANHGMVAVGSTLEQALWRAVELETVARQYVLALSIGGAELLDDSDMESTLIAFADYGRQSET